jgi:hypothetical protein
MKKLTLRACCSILIGVDVPGPLPVLPPLDDPVFPLPADAVFTAEAPPEVPEKVGTFTEW